MNEKITLELDENELKHLISSLLFQGSVNVVSNINKEEIKEIYQLALKIKEKIPTIKLDYVSFIDEECFEDEASPLILENFKDNIEIHKSLSDF